MAYLHRKKRSPFWYVQYLDSDRKKHDKSTGLRADDPNVWARDARVSWRDACATRRFIDRPASQSPPTNG